jgi:hypothetical protein
MVYAGAVNFDKSNFLFTTVFLFLLTGSVCAQSPRVSWTDLREHLAEIATTGCVSFRSEKFSSSKATETTEVSSRILRAQPREEKESNEKLASKLLVPRGDEWIPFSFYWWPEGMVEQFVRTSSQSTGTKEVVSLVHFYKGNAAMTVHVLHDEKRAFVTSGEYAGFSADFLGVAEPTALELSKNTQATTEEKTLSRRVKSKAAHADKKSQSQDLLYYWRPGEYGFRHKEQGKVQEYRYVRDPHAPVGALPLRIEVRTNEKTFVMERSECHDSKDFPAVKIVLQANHDPQRFFENLKEEGYSVTCVRQKACEWLRSLSVLDSDDSSREKAEKK